MRRIGVGVISKLGPNPARADQTPAAHRLEDCKQPEDHQRQAHTKVEIGRDDSGNEEEPAQNPAHQSAAKLEVATKETAHAKCYHKARAKPMIQMPVCHMSRSIRSRVSVHLCPRWISESARPAACEDHGVPMFAPGTRKARCVAAYFAP